MIGFYFKSFFRQDLQDKQDFTLIPHFPEENEEGQPDFVGKYLLTNCVFIYRRQFVSHRFLQESDEKKNPENPENPVK
jgi:hypothetical protein